MFEGYQNTPLLWKSTAVYNLEQFSPKLTSKQFYNNSEYKKLRLGKWVENFVSFQLQQDDYIELLEENLIINNDSKQTIGELDLLFLKDHNPIHLEIIYKFYLYDINKKQSELLNFWVGPNQNDALIYKLTKLKEKQLPLLHHPKTKDILKHYKLNFNTIKQKVCFKAQLFLPYGNNNIDVSPLNANCVVGWHLNIENIHYLKNYQFYIPKKLEWLCLPHENVNWCSYKQAKDEIKSYTKSRQSPLCWLKKENNEFIKCFITWW
ncbi:DUF1853 family protein [Winogradskyella litoriviva]|uniref:DUF1853 family protein n=2 Tax=Winogradskyella litoriviva TaxID=1220182 RepID=A0ABX2E7L8_9FLAO|nr:DUF1853 family protein [Winogradskyella litoriviva]